MTVTVDSFRLGFPEFNTVDYPDSMVQFWLDRALELVNPSAWGRSFDLGVQLFVAHNVVIEKRNEKAAAGGVPGAAGSGTLASKSVGPISVSYDTSIGLNPDDGQWNLTNYGTRFAALVRMFGAMPIQVSGHYEY